MIDSFRTHSSFLYLAPALLYGLITETHSISHYRPSSIPSSLALSFLHLFSLSIHPPCYSSVSRKGGCQSPSAASPSSNPLHVPSSLPPSVHLSHPSLSLFPLFLSHSFLPPWHSFLYKLSPSLFKAFLYLSSSPFALLCCSLRVCQAHRDGKKQTQILLPILAVALSLGLPRCLFRSLSASAGETVSVDTARSNTDASRDAPWETISWPGFLILSFLCTVPARAHTHTHTLMPCSVFVCLYV